MHTYIWITHAYIHMCACVCMRCVLFLSCSLSPCFISVASCVKHYFKPKCLSKQMARNGMNRTHERMKDMFYHEKPFKLMDYTALCTNTSQAIFNISAIASSAFKRIEGLNFLRTLEMRLFCFFL